MSTVRAFIDANVWYSAAYKSTGHARQIISGVLPNLSFITSHRILADARKSLERDAPNRLNILETLIAALGKKLQVIPNPPKEVVLKERKTVLDFDDAIVVAGARDSGSDYLVTWNTKDFVQEKISDIKIITPAELVKILDKE